MSTTSPPVDSPRLRIRPGALVVPNEAGDLARLAVGTRIVRTAGHAAVRILHLLDGTRTLDELKAELVGDEVAEDDVTEAIRTLQLYGLVEAAGNGNGHHHENGNGNGNGAAPPAEPTPQMRAFSDQGHDGAALWLVLRKGRVGVVGAGKAAAAVAEALRRYEVGSVETVALQRPADPMYADGSDLPEADVYVVASDPLDPAFLVWFNKVALRHHLPWIPLNTSGFFFRIGPFVLPHETACWVCYERRVESNLVYYDDHIAVRAAIQKRSEPMPPADNLVPGVVELAANLVALEAVRFLASRASLLEPALFGKTLEYALLSMQGTMHTVLKLPRCPACSARARGFPSIRPWMQPNAEPTSHPVQ
ncbi:MAG TPA: TOMM precursor leader peptide-binding protein [Longimicrobiaceae bacterium]|nr:TOMM precursor leader peptide-binding protein [Longimicrobiaceae bacterium]